MYSGIVFNAVIDNLLVLQAVMEAGSCRNASHVFVIRSLLSEFEGCNVIPNAVPVQWSGWLFSVWIVPLCIDPLPTEPLNPSRFLLYKRLALWSWQELKLYNMYRYIHTHVNILLIYINSSDRIHILYQFFMYFHTCDIVVQTFWILLTHDRIHKSHTSESPVCQHLISVWSAQSQANIWFVQHSVISMCMLSLFCNVCMQLFKEWRLSGCAAWRVGLLSPDWAALCVSGGRSQRSSWSRKGRQGCKSLWSA